MDPKQAERVCLKKQSQCQFGQIAVSSMIVKVYGHFCVFGRFWKAKNKAKQSQFRNVSVEKWPGTIIP